jgi:hypothetical protein
MTMTEGQYQQDRNAAYDRILSLVQRHIDAIPIEMTIDLSLISPSKARDAAERDVWKLFLSGIQHLKNGGQMNDAGSFANAVSKASMRNAPMAATLGLKPPQFEENYFAVDFDSGAAEAVFLSRRLLEAAASDAPKSQQLIRQKLGFTAPLVMPDTNAVQDPELRGVFDAAQKSATPKDAGEDDMLAKLRRHTVLSFNLFCEVYAPAAATLKGEIAELFSQPPPKPGLRNQSFDL